MFTSVLCVISPREFLSISNFKRFQKRKRKQPIGQRPASQRTGAHKKTGIPGAVRMLEPAGACLYRPWFSVFQHLFSKQDAVCPSWISTDLHLLSFSGPFAMGYVHHQVWFLWYKLERVLGETSESQMGYWNARPPPSQKTDLNGPRFPFSSHLFSKKSFYFGNKGCNPFIFPDIVLYILTKNNSYRQ